MFCRVRPDLCWVGLFPLNFGHLADRMLFARCRKQGHRKENSEDGLANEATHNALAQLSASLVTCKPKARIPAFRWRALTAAVAARVSNAGALGTASTSTKD